MLTLGLSITPVLCRTLGRTVVREFLYPAILDPLKPLSYVDQYAFRPTGSTTAALIALPQTITDLLETDPFVIVIALDFSKAFDTVRHNVLLNKIVLLNIPNSIYNWFVDFWASWTQGRSHVFCFGGGTSNDVGRL